MKCNLNDWLHFRENLILFSITFAVEINKKTRK